MYWDVQEASEQYACELKEYLDSPVHDRSTNGESRGGTPNQTAEDSNVPDSDRVSDCDRRDLSSYPPPAAIPLATSLSHQEHYASASCYVKPIFLELCFNGGKHRRTLEEIDITSAMSDGQLFNSIANIYWQKRETTRLFAFGKFAWRFRKPSRVSFRKVMFSQL